MLSDEAKRSLYAIDSVRFTRGLFIQVVKENKLQGTVHRFLEMTMALLEHRRSVDCPRRSWQYAVGKGWREMAP